MHSLVLNSGEILPPRNSPQLPTTIVLIAFIDLTNAETAIEGELKSSLSGTRSLYTLESLIGISSCKCDQSQIAIALIERVKGLFHGNHNQNARCHSLMMRSAHSTNETYIEVSPHLAPQFVKSASVTPRAREQAPQAKTGMRLATIFSIVSVSGGQPTGLSESTVALRIRYVASAVRKICTL